MDQAFRAPAATTTGVRPFSCSLSPAPGGLGHCTMVHGAEFYEKRVPQVDWTGESSVAEPNPTVASKFTRIQDTGHRTQDTGYLAMDSRATQDTGGPSSSRANDASAIFENSTDFAGPFASTASTTSTEVWDNLDDPSTPDSLSSGAAFTPEQQELRQQPLHKRSPIGKSPDLRASPELAGEAGTKSPHKRNLTKRGGPRKRQCSSEDSHSSKTIPDPTALDCSDYWLRFDSDEEAFEILFDSSNSPQSDTKLVGPFCCPTFTCGGCAGTDARSFSLNSFAESSFADAPARSLSPSRRLSHSSTARTPPNPGDANHAPLQLMTSELIDDSALDEALSDDDDDDLFSMTLLPELGKPATATTTSSSSSSSSARVPPPEVEERLYSTPLSWEPPRPGYHMDYMNTNMLINDVERQRLLAIALGASQQSPPTQQISPPPTVADFQFEMPYNNSCANVSRTSCSPDRKSPGNTAGARSTHAPQTREKPRHSSERAAHNDIERKYRTNLKDKIAELRDAIPSLRAIPEDDDPNSSVGSSRTAPKVSKGTVLAKATEYIRQLERRNRSASHKNEELCRRLQAFEQLLGAGLGPNWRQPQNYAGPLYNTRF
ncbi:helix-loop-helix DNA-binding domain-containing protein [Xylaria sp. CBS 124048]|nr:helix-loop-helix DNA-binding domain-containing protein [Xylaria sp. CBS 124048]